ncbi:MAG: nicotinate-nucleotide adenylyltransferase [Actinomycetota bacterium]
MGKRTGIMGGTFDPIHIGHLVTAEEAATQFRLDTVVFVPTGEPWLKEQHRGHEVTAGEHRYLMTVIATAGNPRFTVSRKEIDRGGPTYTVDTLTEVREELGPNTELFFITGADAMLEIFAWKDPEEVLVLAHFIAATRPGFDLAHFEREAPTSHPNITVMDIPALSISSSDIRARVRDGRPIRYLVPAGVQEYIQKEGLYRS